MATFTKTNLVERVAEFENFTSKKQAGEFVNDILALIRAEVAAGNEVSLAGFGKFVSAEQAARSGVAMGVEYSTPARNVPKFKAAKQFKEEVAGA